MIRNKIITKEKSRSMVQKQYYGSLYNILNTRTTKHHT